MLYWDIGKWLGRQIFFHRLGHNPLLNKHVFGPVSVIDRNLAIPPPWRNVLVKPAVVACLRIKPIKIPKRDLQPSLITPS